MKVGVPERFAIHHEGSGLRISFPWSRVTGVILLIFATAWDAFLVGWYLQLLSSDRVPIHFVLFPIGHVAVGVAFTYFAFANLLNTTSIRVESGQLTMVHRPLWFPGHRRLRAADVRQLFCVERTHRRGVKTYDVMVRLASDRELTLVSGLTSDREARFIEQQIESRLGLVNVAVPGELPALR